jgi:hypothetical protein
MLSTKIAGGGKKNAVYHEYTHLFLRTQFSGTLPLWFDEGLAELMGATEFQSATVLVGTPEIERGSKWIPLSRLLLMDKKSEEYRSESTYSVHFESWAIVHRVSSRTRHSERKCSRTSVPVRMKFPSTSA